MTTVASPGRLSTEPSAIQISRPHSQLSSWRASGSVEAADEIAQPRVGEHGDYEPLHYVDAADDDPRDEFAQIDVRIAGGQPVAPSLQPAQAHAPGAVRGPDQYGEDHRRDGGVQQSAQQQRPVVQLVPDDPDLLQSLPGLFDQCVEALPGFGINVVVQDGKQEVPAEEELRAARLTEFGGHHGDRKVDR